MDKRLTERNFKIIDTLTAIAEEVGASPAATALRWIQYQYRGLIPIIGARKIDQLKDNLSSVNIELSASQLERLNEASKIDPGFPYDFITGRRIGHANVNEMVNGSYKEDMAKEMKRRTRSH